MRQIKMAVAALAVASCGDTQNETSTQSAGKAATAAREIALVANAEAGTVSFLDVDFAEFVGELNINPDGKVVERPGTPNYAQDTDLSPDGRTLYVSRGYLGDVAAFDIASGRKLWATPVDAVRADHMTITADGRSLFVSALTENRVRRLDAATGTITGEFVSGVFPHDNQISADGRQVINSSLGDMQKPLADRDHIAAPSDASGYAYELTVADAETLKVDRRIRMPVGIRPWHMRHANDAFYAQASNHHAVILYSYPGGEEMGRLELPVAAGVSEADWDFEAPHHGLALSHDGLTLCLAGRASDYAALVNAPQLSLIATIPVGDAPGWSAFAKEDSLCILANTRDDTVSIVSVAEAKEVKRLPAGDGPKHITVGMIPSEVLVARSGS